MKNRTQKLFLVLSAVVLLRQTAFANAGTPLMWAEVLHLVFGNLAIGLGEGLLLGFIFRLPKWKSIGIMILANYISAWLGYLILESSRPAIQHSITIYEIKTFIWVAYGIAFVFTLVAESPFIFILMRQKKHTIIRTLIASFIIQGISYCGIFYWYWKASFDSLFHNTQIVRSFEFQYPESILYFFGEDQNVYQMRMDGTEKQKIYDLNAKQELMKLYLQGSKVGADLCLCGLTDFYTEREENRVVIKKHVLPADQLEALHVEEHMMVWTEAIDYRPQTQKQWQIRTGFWAAQGLELWNEETEEFYSITLETPFAQWYVRSATVLPGDEVIFQLGNQICIYSRSTKQLYLLTKGTSPVVIFYKPDSAIEATKEY